MPIWLGYKAVILYQNCKLLWNHGVLGTSSRWLFIDVLCCLHFLFYFLKSGFLRCWTAELFGNTLNNINANNVTAYLQSLSYSQSSTGIPHISLELRLYQKQELICNFKILCLILHLVNCRWIFTSAGKNEFCSQELINFIIKHHLHINSFIFMNKITCLHVSLKADVFETQ